MARVPYISRHLSRATAFVPKGISPFSDQTLTIGGDYNELLEYLQGLSSGDTKKILKATAWRLARRTAVMVRRAYKSADFERSPGTLESYQTAPTKAGASFRAWPGAQPLSRSGLLAKSVKAGLNPYGGEGYVVQIDPNKIYGGDPKDAGKRVADIAAQIEFPRPVVYTVTNRMLRYLHWIAKRQGHTHAPSGVTVGSAIVYWPRARPVWKKVFEKLRGMRSEIAREIGQRLGTYRKDRRAALSLDVGFNVG